MHIPGVSIIRRLLQIFSNWVELRRSLVERAFIEIFAIYRYNYLHNRHLHELDMEWIISQLNQIVI